MSAPFILASASPRRLELLKQIGLAPQAIEPADIDETPKKEELPLAYVQRMAHEKAAVIAMRHPGVRVLAADTIVCCGRRILPKAEDAATARKCLEMLSGRRHRVITAIALGTNDTIRVKYVSTAVRFTRLQPADIEAYIACGEWEGKAGGYAIQGAASAFIPAINGSYSNVVGLPLAETLALLKR